MADTLPQPSVAQMLNVRVSAQGVPASTCETWTVEGLQPSEAITLVITLASVGRVAGLGLKPKLELVGALRMTGAVVSLVQVMVWV